jgi:hypothetical protein
VSNLKRSGKKVGALDGNKIVLLSGSRGDWLTRAKNKIVEKNDTALVFYQQLSLRDDPGQLEVLLHASANCALLVWWLEDSMVSSGSTELWLGIALGRKIPIVYGVSREYAGRGSLLRAIQLMVSTFGVQYIEVDNVDALSFYAGELLCQTK